MKIAVGSKNPVKIAAVREAFLAVFPKSQCEVIGVEVSSGVSNQPLSDKESITGAKNRAHKARAHLQADYGVGLEGGLHKIDNMWFEAGWIVVVDKTGKEGIGASIKMLTPKKFITLIKKGIELGIATDMIFNKKNSKQHEGYFGVMTKGAITRTKGYKDGVIAALARFLQPEVFE